MERASVCLDCVYNAEVFVYIYLNPKKKTATSQSTLYNEDGCVLKCVIFSHPYYTELNEHISSIILCSSIVYRCSYFAPQCNVVFQTTAKCLVGIFILNKLAKNPQQLSWKYYTQFTRFWMRSIYNNFLHYFMFF